jgi:hypothetical protein
MEDKNQMLSIFQVEELEKRYEMGWVKIEVGPCGCDDNVIAIK